MFRIGSGSDSPVSFDDKEVQVRKENFDLVGWYVLVYG